MKKPFFYLIALLFITFLYSCMPRAVVVKPAPVVTVRPAAPSPQHVWVGGNYVRRGGKHVWVNGYWTTPRQHKHWVDGHWRSHKKGYVWVPGRWR
jgi:hypothetical protein